MTNFELNSLTGVEFSMDEYAIIDAAYLRSGLENEEFCSSIARCAVSGSSFFSVLSVAVDAVKKDKVYSTACMLIDRSVEEDSSFLARTAIDMIGKVQFLAYKVKKGYHLYRKDREDLLEIVGQERLLEILEKAGQSEQSPVQDVDFESAPSED